jgi:hypothetical protein
MAVPACLGDASKRRETLLLKRRLTSKKDSRQRRPTIPDQDGAERGFRARNIVRMV